MLNWLIFDCFEKCDEPSGDVGFNFGLNVFHNFFLHLKKLNKKTKELHTIMPARGLSACTPCRAFPRIFDRGYIGKSAKTKGKTDDNRSGYKVYSYAMAEELILELTEFRRKV